MRRGTLFLGIVLGAALGLVLIILWYLSVYQGQSGSLTGMMGQMMGGSYSGGMTRVMPSGVWAGVLALSIAAIAGVMGLAYYVALPEIAVKSAISQHQTSPEIDYGQSWSAPVRTSNPEEKKVLEVLTAHGGKYLQKYVVKESGLSKLKTHRILSRFAARGVITAEKKGNTNEISLAPWLIQDAPKPSVP